jgi:hypothetical protein
MYMLANSYDQHAAQLTGKMMASLRKEQLTVPFKEYVLGYNGWLDRSEAVKLFSGRLRVLTVSLNRGKPFELKVELMNSGCMPWISGIGQKLELGGDANRFGLPDNWDYTGKPMVFGDIRIITLKGLAPTQTGTFNLKIDFLLPGRSGSAKLSQTVELMIP